MHWLSKLRYWCNWRKMSRSDRRTAVSLLLSLVLIVLQANPSLRNRWARAHLPEASYRGLIPRGVAVSFNALEKKLGQNARLPAMVIRGFLWDHQRHDWVIFGDEDAGAPSLPVDAVVVAVRAVRSELQTPGIDIRAASAGAGSQTVQYFGGVGQTVVGQWFFDFDYWMKRASLNDTPIPVAGVGGYWENAWRRLNEEVEQCHEACSVQCVRHNRYWLHAGDFSAVEEGGDVVAFQKTALQVLAESTKGAAPAGVAPSSGDKIDDPLAAKFASELTAHLAELSGCAPIREIEEFAKLLAGITWLSGNDADRDLQCWLKAAVAPIQTPSTVATLNRSASGRHAVMTGGQWINHEHRIELSGGVEVSPRLERFRSSNSALKTLLGAILAARPADNSGTWHFAYIPA